MLTSMLLRSIEQVAIIVVIQLPPRLSLSTEVIIELRYGMCCRLLSDSATITYSDGQYAEVNDKLNTKNVKTKPVLSGFRFKTILLMKTIRRAPVTVRICESQCITSLSGCL